MAILLWNVAFLHVSFGFFAANLLTHFFSDKRVHLALLIARAILGVEMVIIFFAMIHFAKLSSITAGVWIVLFLLMVIANATASSHKRFQSLRPSRSNPSSVTAKSRRKYNADPAPTQVQS